MKLYQTVTMFGGGFDSASWAVLEARKDRVKKIHLVHVDYGQKACKGERMCLSRLSSKYPNIHPILFKASFMALNCNSALLSGTPASPNQRAYWLEGRNLHLALIGVRFANRVQFAFPDESHSTNPSVVPPDTTYEWCDSVSRFLASKLSRPIVIQSVCHDIEKSTLAALAAGEDPEAVEYFYNCYEYPACGKCVRCQWRKSLLKHFGLKDRHA